MLTNKYFDETTCLFTATGDTTKQLKHSVSGMATGKEVTLAFGMGQSTTVTFPDPGSVSASVLYNVTNQSTAGTFIIVNTEDQMQP